jgi:cystathionine gamma-synthase
VVLDLASQVLAYTKATALKSGNNELSASSVSSPLHSQLALLLPTYRSANACHAYFHKVGSTDSEIIHFTFSGETTVLQEEYVPSDETPDRQLYAVTYAETFASEGKAFWQHTGAGISSRCAVYWLEHAPFLENKIFPQGAPVELPLEEGNSSALMIRERIANSLSSQVEDVTLYPTGMSAISNISLAVRSLYDRKDGLHRVAVFGQVISHALVINFSWWISNTSETDSYTLILSRY